MNKHISIMGALPALVLFLSLAGCGGGGGGGGGSETATATGDAGGDSSSLESGSVDEVSVPVSNSGQADSTNTDTVIGPGANAGVDSNTGSSTDSGSVAWLPPTLNVDDSAFTDLTGYKIYIGSEPGRFEIVRELKEPGLSEYVLEGLPAGTYYVGMTAVNSQNIESPLSNVVVRTVGGS